jgi:hypothetical protein
MDIGLVAFPSRSFSGHNTGTLKAPVSGPFHVHAPRLISPYVVASAYPACRVYPAVPAHESPSTAFWRAMAARTLSTPSSLAIIFFGGACNNTVKHKWACGSACSWSSGAWAYSQSHRMWSGNLISNENLNSVAIRR